MSYCGYFYERVVNILSLFEKIRQYRDLKKRQKEYDIMLFKLERDVQWAKKDCIGERSPFLECRQAGLESVKADLEDFRKNNKRPA